MAPAEPRGVRNRTGRGSGSDGLFARRRLSADAWRATGLKIEAAELRVLQMRLLKPFRTSFGVQQDRSPLLIRLEIDGRSHWGECVAGEGPWYSSETIETAWQMLKGYLLPAVLGGELADIPALETLLAPVRGHHMAKAAVEMALTGAFAEQARKPLGKFLGGVRDRVE